MNYIYSNALDSTNTNEFNEENPGTNILQGTPFFELSDLIYHHYRGHKEIEYHIL